MISTCRTARHRLASGVVSQSAVGDISPLDAFMRRLLRLPAGAGTTETAEKAFGTSILISTVRCLLTYIVLPLLKPVVDLSGGVGPIVGLVIGAVSATAIVYSMRRFWRANHKWRWGYTVLGGGILVLLAVQAVGDVAALF
jgi:hypothetical protein